MTQQLYRLLLCLYPSRYRSTFGREMAEVFRQAQSDAWNRGAIYGTIFCIREFGGVVLAAVWEHFSGCEIGDQRTAVRVFDGIPTFYTCRDYAPRRSALIHGAILTIATFGTVCWAISYGAWHPLLLVGSHGRNHSGLLEAQGPAVAQTDLSTEVTLKPESEGEPWRDYASTYFRVILVLHALDANRDYVISASEIANAPKVLQTLDRNHDRKLTPDECGQSFADNPAENAADEAKLDGQLLKRMRLAFMRLHPVLAALDADHDGEISATEIHNAAVALKTLDRNGDGKLTPDELFPDPLANALAHFMPLEVNGSLSQREWSRRFAHQYWGLFEDADRNEDGIVTEEELKDEIRRRANRNLNSDLTQEELQNAFRSGAFEGRK